jgi:hypothetical protein
MPKRVEFVPVSPLTGPNPNPVSLNQLLASPQSSKPAFRQFWKLAASRKPAGPFSKKGIFQLSFLTARTSPQFTIQNNFPSPDFHFSNIRKFDLHFPIIRKIDFHFLRSKRLDSILQLDFLATLILLGWQHDMQIEQFSNNASWPQITHNARKTAQAHGSLARRPLTMQ